MRDAEPGIAKSGRQAVCELHCLRQLPVPNQRRGERFFGRFDAGDGLDVRVREAAPVGGGPVREAGPSAEAYTGETAVRQLSLAYALTGDERYAHRAGVMLNRLAEVYRFYNGTVDEQRPLTRGYLVQVSWEEWPIHDCAAACDLILDAMLADGALLDFFRSKGDCDYNGDGQVDFEDIRYNVQHNLLGYMYEWLHRAMAIQTGDCIVREGMVLCALGAMLDNRELIEEAVDGRYGLAVNLTNNTFRDGKWWYDSPGYAVGTTRTLLERLFSMKQLGLFGGPGLRLREAVAFVRDIYCDGRLPAIGDTGSADSRMRVLDPLAPCEVEEWAYIHTGDEAYRERLLALSKGDADRIREGYAGPQLLFHADSIRFRRAGDAGVCAAEVDGERVETDAEAARVTVYDSGECELHLVQGTFLRFGDRSLEGPEIARGRVERVDPEARSVVVTAASGEAPAEGDFLVFKNPAYICNSSYEVVRVEAMDANRYRLELNMSLVLSEGIVRAVDREAGGFDTDTCMTKLEVCPGLFDGKSIRAAGNPVGCLSTAETDAEGSAGKVNVFRFADRKSALGLEAGAPFTVCDLQAGDLFELTRSLYKNA